MSLPPFYEISPYEILNGDDTKFCSFSYSRPFLSYIKQVPVIQLTPFTQRTLNLHELSLPHHSPITLPYESTSPLALIFDSTTNPIILYSTFYYYNQKNYLVIGYNTGVVSFILLETTVIIKTIQISLNPISSIHIINTTSSSHLIILSSTDKITLSHLLLSSPQHNVITTTKLISPQVIDTADKVTINHNDIVCLNTEKKIFNVFTVDDKSITHSVTIQLNSLNYSIDNVFVTNNIVFILSLQIKNSLHQYQIDVFTTNSLQSNSPLRIQRLTLDLPSPIQYIFPNHSHPLLINSCPHTLTGLYLCTTSQIYEVRSIETISNLLITAYKTTSPSLWRSFNQLHSDLPLPQSFNTSLLNSLPTNVCHNLLSLEPSLYPQVFQRLLESNSPQNQYDFLLSTIQSLAQTNPKIASDALDIFLLRENLFSPNDSLFPRFLATNPYYPHIKAISKLLNSPHLTYVLRQSDRQAIVYYCSFLRKVKPIVDWIDSALNKDPTVAFPIVDTPPLLSSLNVNFQFKIITDAISRDPQPSHVMVLRNVVELIDKELIPKCIEIGCNIVIRNALSLINSGISKVLNVIHAICLIRLKKVYLFLILNNWYIDAAVCLLLYQQIIPAIDLLLDHYKEIDYDKNELLKIIVELAFNHQDKTYCLYVFQQFLLHSLQYNISSLMFNEILNNAYHHSSMLVASHFLNCAFGKDSKFYSQLLILIEPSLLTSFHIDCCLPEFMQNLDIIIFCNNNHCFTHDDLKSLVNGLYTKYPSNNNVIKMKSLYDDFILNNIDQMLICPRCLQTSLSHP
ncbi:CNH domain-containing protein [Entamoeba marina]